MATVSELAMRQHGIATRSQLLAVGVPAATVGGWIRRGYLHPIHRGVYAVGHALTTQEGRWLAAVLACGPGSFLSHGPAGQLLGILSRRERFAMHVSLSDGVDRSPRGIVAHRPRRLEPQDRTLRNRIPVTTMTRTVWDLAMLLTPLGTRRAFEQAERRGLDRDRLRSLLEAAPSRKGAGTIRELLGERSLPLAATRSRLEELLVIACRDHGLPMPAIDVPILGFEVDFLWPAARLVVEADGGEHLNRVQRDKDNARDAILARAGYLIRRYSWSALGDGGSVASEIAEVLGERLRT